MMHITGKEYQLKDIFCNKFIMRIPTYQRPYAWGVEETQTLLDDLLNAMGDLDDDTDDQKAYFLGSIVIVKDDQDPNALVVDGQQRLTTLTILFAVIRSLMKEGKNKKSLSKKIFMEEDEILKEEDCFFLTLRERDSEFFQKNIQRDENLENVRTMVLAGEIDNDSKKNIVENSRRLLDLLQDKTEEQLKKIAAFIVNNTYIIVVTTPTTETAYQIFSILNARGLDLSFTDICKAELIGKIGKNNSKIEAAYTEKWETAEDELGTDNFKDLFGHIRTIFRKARLRDTILQEYKNFIFPLFPDPTKFIDDVLLPFKSIYDAIKNFQFAGDKRSDEINYYLQLFRWIDNSDWLPPALLFIHKHKNQMDNILHFLIDLERLAGSMMVRRANVNTRQTKYNKILDWIEQGKDLQAVDSPLQLTSEEIRETIDRLNGDVYHSTAKGYILRRLNGLLSEDRLTPNTPIFTVEHVLPQNPKPDSTWIQWYPDPIERNRITQTIGNLALLSKRMNRDAYYYEFLVKKDKYFGTPVAPFALTIQIIKETDWTQKTYQKKQEQYVDLLKTAWRLEA